MTHLKGSSGRLLALACVVLLGAATLVVADASEEGGKVEFICPPCGSDCHDEVFEKAGSCPICNMALVEKGKKNPNVAIFVFDGVQIIDYTGPYEVFGQGPYNVFTVSETGETITTAMKMSVNPTYSFATSPKPDILIVPGGTVHHQYESEKVVGWIRDRAQEAEHVLTVCNGAFIVAKTGLLDGKSATTFYGLIDELKTFAPEVNVVSDQRYVDNGKIITSAGLSSGIDASLYLISKLNGMGRAQNLALHLEYDWRPDSGFARAAFPDRLMPNLQKPEGSQVQMVSTSGDRDQWEKRWELEYAATTVEVMEFINDQYAKRDSWSKSNSLNTADHAEATWILKDEAGNRWVNEILVQKTAAEEDSFLITAKIHRLAATKTTRLD